MTIMKEVFIHTDPQKLEAYHIGHKGKNEGQSGGREENRDKSLYCVFFFFQEKQSKAE